MTQNILNSPEYLSDMRTYISDTERKRGQWNKATAYYADFLLDSYIEICKWYADMCTNLQNHYRYEKGYCSEFCSYSAN